MGKQAEELGLLPGGPGHEHDHEAEPRHPQRKEVVNRLARVEGHVRAIKRMAEDGRACTDLLVQLAAVRAAVDGVSRVVLADHVESCLRGAAASGMADEEWQRLKEALDRFIA